MLESWPRESSRAQDHQDRGTYSRRAWCQLQNQQDRFRYFHTLPMTPSRSCIRALHQKASCRSTSPPASPQSLWKGGFTILRIKEPKHQFAALAPLLNSAPQNRHPFVAPSKSVAAS